VAERMAAYPFSYACFMDSLFNLSLQHILGGVMVSGLARARIN
jgi:hypothetical protein